jgi:hypothetical protein
MIEGAGGQVHEMGRLPDGSGFATASFELPKDHWIYGDAQRPPMTMRTGTDHPRRKELEQLVREAGKYAVRSATRSGKDDDFDPDALLQNLIVGLFGYHTSDGLTNMGEEDSRLFDPQPVPPPFEWLGA